jgi:hypothetical protein
VGSIATVALLAVMLAALAPAQSKQKADLSVTQVNGVPATAMTGDVLPLQIKVANNGRAKSKAFKVTARLAPETGSPVPLVIGASKAGPLAPRRSTTMTLEATIPSWAPGTWTLVACVPPGKGQDDCRASSPVEIGDGSPSALIDEARDAGDLDPGEADLYGLYALTGDSRLPSIYRGNGEGDGNGTFGDIAADWSSLSQAEQEALWPYFLQPRYAQSAWVPPSEAKARQHRSAKGAAPGPCDDLDELQGAWNGVDAGHAWVWYQPGSPSRQAKAQALASEFQQKIWPKLTGAFQEVDDAASAPCDPVGDSKIDIYLDPALHAGVEGGVAPRVPFGAACGPNPSFVILRAGATRWTLAHEFMHVIGWSYKACDRHPTWVEGVATWAGEFVYHNDQDEHTYLKGLFFSYSSLLGEDAGNYQSWPFWYSVAKQGGPEAIKQFIVALGTGDVRQALGALPGGLRTAWKRYAVQGWNDVPIGSSGFPVSDAFKQWDSFAIKPVVEPETMVLLGGQTEHTFDLTTYGPGGFGEGGGDLGPLSTSYKRVKIGDDNVRELRFQNALAGNPAAVVQAFLKLKSGKWRLEDWSDQNEVTLCRDETEENVTEMVIATSNASATGGPLGRATHHLRARDSCTQAPIQGTFSGTEYYTSDGGEVTMSYTLNGTVTFERNGSTNPAGEFGGTYPDATWARYTVAGGTITYSGSGTSFGCTVDVPPQTGPLYEQGLLALEPGPEPRYGIRDVSTQELAQAMFSCPPDDQSYPGSFSPPAGIHTPDPRQTMQRGTYVGSSTITGPNGNASYNWTLSEG